MAAREYTSRRYAILTALSEKFKLINGQGSYRTNLFGNSEPRMQFWDELMDNMPAVRMALGPERRVYQGGGYKDRFLSVTVRCYVKEEDPQNALELLLEDLETVIEENGRLAYIGSSGQPEFTQDMLIMSIDTDEGALAPLGVGEILLQVRY